MAEVEPAVLGLRWVMVRVEEELVTITADVLSCSLAWRIIMNLIVRPVCLDAIADVVAPTASRLASRQRRGVEAIASS